MGRAGPSPNLHRHGKFTDPAWKMCRRLGSSVLERGCKPGQTSRVALPHLRRTLALVLAEWLALAPTALANPQGGIVRSGSAVITGQGTPVVTIQQRSQNAVLSWQTFNIKPGETTNFQQPGQNAVAINRILS